MRFFVTLVAFVGLFCSLVIGDLETEGISKIRIKKSVGWSSQGDCFFESVKKLAPYDKHLYSRVDVKNGLIAKGMKQAEWLQVMNIIDSFGNSYACGYTRNWIAEILQGLNSQYDELVLKNNSGWPAAGFVNVTGQKVVDLFNSNLNSSKRMLYKFQIVGPLDHVWLVEQLANGKGYRVYQSYNNAYSLKAWLATGNLDSMLGTDIIIWHDVVRMADAAIKPKGGSMSNLDNLPAALLPLKPWLVYIRDYNLTQVKAELEKAWTKVGQGKIMTKGYFYDNYLHVLANLTEAIIPFVSTNKIWERKLHEMWTSLFGAPNPVLYPGYPFNTLTAQFSQNYALEVKVLAIDLSAEAMCPARAKILENSIADCFRKNVGFLANYDALLYSRHDEKKQLIAKGTSKPNYLNIMSKIKSSGKTFACGYTRGWIAEILQGLSSQYDEFATKQKSGWPAAGYLNVTGQKVVDLFNGNLKSIKRILYKFQIVGPLDHVWLVEQLAYGKGYRVYQSYNNAYSLKAWLATGNLDSMLGTDIIIWHDVVRMADAAIKPKGGSMSNLDNLPAALLPLKPWLVYIRDYNLTQVKAELEKAWTKVGQGKIMTKGYFYDNYLHVLANLTEAIIPFVSTNKIWERKLHEMWTSLFGAPNPVLYPGYPFNTLTAQFSQNYALEVKALVIDYPAEARCHAGAKILVDSLKDCFFDTLHKLSVHDILLNSRLDVKKRLITQQTGKAKWLSTMRTVKSSGNSFASGHTSSWTSEIPQGLSSQYDELLAGNASGAAAAGYQNAIGWKVVDLFNKYINSTKRVLYKLQIVGPFQHVWLVEQLPYGAGYRVYQSYQNAYSLRAWLQKSGDFKSLHGRDVVVWQEVLKMMTAYIKKEGGSMDDLNNLPLSVCTMKSWLIFVKNYNLTQVDANLNLARNKFGKGQIIQKDLFFKSHLHVLANLTRDVTPLVGTPKKWTQVLHDQWISLFGSPNPYVFPDGHFNQLTQRFSQNYALEVKVIEISEADELQCVARGQILEKSLHCFYDGVKELSVNDKLLNSRLENKTSLIQKSTNKTEFVRIMDTITSTGKTFACGFTRSWIAEILQGLESQYDELLKKHKNGTAAAGFVNVTGQKVVDLFNSNLNSSKRILYKFQIVGPLDHVWLVEQLANGKGYRVYQSYNNAYSLKAWLATGNLDSMLGTDIIIWHDVVRMADAAIKPKGGSMSNLDNLPAALLPLKPWLVYIRDYNLTQVKAELEKAWTKVGQGKIMTKGYFYDNYLHVLANLTEAIIPFVSTNKVWERKLHEMWTSLFGAPNPVLYPGYPFNTLTAQYSQKYALEVRVLKISPKEEANCVARVDVMRRSFPRFPPTTAKPKPSTTVAQTTGTLKVPDGAVGRRPAVLLCVVLIAVVFYAMQI